jgi:mevalonate kinase
MKWQIPAKTFLVGEYLAIINGPAIVLATQPCFEMSLVQQDEILDIHPDSPAGQWWLKNKVEPYGLRWKDPYNGLGGLGASSAQFLGAYLATCKIFNQPQNREILLDAYLQCAWSKEGAKPSGYDVLAQTQNQCVFIDKQKNAPISYPWPFKDISFILMHSGQKLSTHYHLKNLILPKEITQLATIVTMAQEAFKKVDSQLLIEAINKYQENLMRLQLTAPHTIEYIRLLRREPNILAAKGCGALGADILLVVIQNEYLNELIHKFKQEEWTILGTNDNLYDGEALIKK